MRIVLTTFGTLGDVHPLIAVALEMRRRGHTPVLAVPEIFRPKIEPLGLVFAKVGPTLNPDDPQQVADLMDIHKGTERTLREVLFPAIRQSYEELLAAVRAGGGADLMLAGELTYQAPVVAEVTGIRWASYVLAPLSFFSAHDAPVLPPYPRLARLQSAVPASGHAVRRFARWVTRNWAEPVYRLRGELGLDHGANVIFDAKHAPSLVLAMFSPLLGEPQPDWPPGTEITGFVFYDGDAGRQELPEEIERFLEAGEEAGEPPVVFTLGSAAVLDAGDFYEQSAEAARMAGVRAVLLVGTDPRNVPRNVPSTKSTDLCVARYAPYSKLFPRASLIVHQGGVGTTAQAMQAGRPMLVMPYSHDQPDNARRMRRLGVAGVIRRQYYTAERAARRIRRILGHPRFAARAAEVGEQLRREDGLTHACDALEWLGRKPG
ncbi:MAG TPA: glycosyltransferase [Acidobacteriaceae bacterium]|jgi:UDP:flavonoid glycosyltransferase YjiC (YdhE family)